jgi:hypothetical protein
VAHSKLSIGNPDSDLFGRPLRNLALAAVSDGPHSHLHRDLPPGLKCFPGLQDARGPRRPWFRVPLNRARGVALRNARRLFMRAANGTIVEVLQWISQEAIAGAHKNPAVLDLWKRFEAVCWYETALQPGRISKHVRALCALLSPSRRGSGRLGALCLNPLPFH